MHQTTWCDLRLHYCCPFSLFPVFSFHLSHCTPTSIRHRAAQQICYRNQYVTQEQSSALMFFRHSQCSTDFQEPPRFPLRQGQGQAVLRKRREPNQQGLTLSLFLYHFQSFFYRLERKGWDWNFLSQLPNHLVNPRGRYLALLWVAFFSLWDSLV